MNQLKLNSFILSLCFLLFSCTNVPENITPVDAFKLKPYLGQWYEIARLPHSFENNLTQVTAQYQLNEDGSVKVINRGLNLCDNKWEQAEGVAKFVGEQNKGHLKVSFFGPFYGAYVIFELGPLSNGQYQYSFVSGPNTDYLWLLARQPDVSEKIKQDFIKQAELAGFNTQNIIWTQLLTLCAD
ncbi:lipocalin family protein [Catenovulum sp. 2E275]|uniref:lipocalin family protein n=1 Tax=Catenovulum sp. 2E275 TaxID=2980497 RepID=UPI0021CEE8B8|nr:lipocalin family protein [Catenovulum sp. 2E275]MCU4677517.1 lipocalin family protein [Catenovulum sp. 2E275]